MPLFARDRQMLDDPQVTFSGYRVQHPLEPAIQIKVQTKSENPGPVQSIDYALGTLEKELEAFDKKFKEAVKAASKGGSGITSTGDGFDPMDVR